MLQIATKSDLGAVKVGAGLQAGDDGTLSVVDGAGSALSMIVTYGSPRIDPSIDNWSPANIVSLYGPPNMPLLVTATDGATFVDHDPGSPNMKSLPLSAQGKAQVQVLLAVGANDRAASIVVAPYIQPKDIVGEAVLAALPTALPVERSAFFYPMMTNAPSWQLFESFGYTRGAPSDGLTPCVISVCLDYQSARQADVTTLQMQVTSGDAVFDPVKQSKSANPAIGTNGVVMANLYCTSPGISTIEVSVPSAKFPDQAQVYASFVAPSR